MPEAAPTVLIIDDDRALREALGRLLPSAGIEARLFASISEFLKTDLPNGPACLVLDVRLPDRSGLDFQRELNASGLQIPIIFMTGYGDIPMSVQAMKGGAIEFLTKQFCDQDVIDAVQIGLARDRARIDVEKAVAVIRERFETLSAREREIMTLVVQGRLNKQIAVDIGISEATVKVHRSNLMKKLKLRSLTELSRMADKLKLVSERS